MAWFVAAVHRLIRPGDDGFGSSGTDPAAKNAASALEPPITLASVKDLGAVEQPGLEAKMLDSLLTHVAKLNPTAAVRQLGLLDAGPAAQFIDSLPNPIRYSRFDRTMTPAMINAHNEALDWNTVIVVASNERDNTVGLSELCPYRAAEGIETEIVLTLAPGSHSVGRPLMARALSHAAAAGAWRSVMPFYPPDSVLLRIARSLDGRCGAAEGSIVFNL